MCTALIKSHMDFFLKIYNDVTCGGSWSSSKNLSRNRGTVDRIGLEKATCRQQSGQKDKYEKMGALWLSSLSN